MPRVNDSNYGTPYMHAYKYTYVPTTQHFLPPKKGVWLQGKEKTTTKNQ